MDQLPAAPKKRRIMAGPALALWLCLLAFAPSAHSAYVDKEDKNPYSTTEPVPAPGTPSVLAPKPGEYPYYGNAPADMLPYRNIEPYYRYWLERLPFRGPGRDYTDPTNLASLK